MPPQVSSGRSIASTRCLGRHLGWLERCPSGGRSVVAETSWSWTVTWWWEVDPLRLVGEIAWGWLNCGVFLGGSFGGAHNKKQIGCFWCFFVWVYLQTGLFWVGWSHGDPSWSNGVGIGWFTTQRKDLWAQAGDPKRWLFYGWGTILGRFLFHGKDGIRVCFNQPEMSTSSPFQNASMNKLRKFQASSLKNLPNWDWDRKLRIKGVWCLEMFTANRGWGQPTFCYLPWSHRKIPWSKKRGHIGQRAPCTLNGCPISGGVFFSARLTQVGFPPWLPVLWFRAEWCDNELRTDATKAEVGLGWVAESSWIDWIGTLISFMEDGKSCTLGNVRSTLGKCRFW